MKSNQRPLALLPGGYGMRNRIINGDMRIDQVNAGAAVSVAAAATARSVDKFNGYGAGAAGVFSLQRLAATPPAGFTNYLRVTVTTADAAPAAGREYSVSQTIEGTYCQDLEFGLAASTKSVTVSFWARSSVAGTFSASIRNGTVARSYPFTFAIAATNTWQLITATIAVDTSGTWVTTTAGAVVLTFDMGSGANARTTAGAWAAGSYVGVTGATQLINTNAATFDLTGVQLEPGTVATGFEQRPIGDMLLLCQREYCKSFNLGTAPAQNAGTSLGEALGIAGVAGATQQRMPVRLPVAMRAAPVVTCYNPGAANVQARDLSAGADCSATSAVTAAENGFLINTTGAAGTAVGNLLAVHWAADARL